MNIRKCFALAAAAVLAAGCSAEADVRVEENAAVIDAAGLRLDIPDGWSVMTGNDIYNEIYPKYSDGFGSAEELRGAVEEAGERYIVYAAPEDGSAVLLAAAQEISGGNERPALEKLARSLHDGTLFEYQAGGYRTGSNSVFEQTELAGHDGILSFFELYFPRDDGRDASEPQFEMAQELFMFEAGDDVWSVQLICSDKENVLRIEDILSEAG